MENYNKRIRKIRKLIDESDYILIGGGAGLSTAAGIDYGGERFQRNFPEFIKKYNLTDMYSSTFYPFKTLEEKWAYLAKHIYLNNIGMEGTEIYKKLLDLIKDKEYFVITTNVDDQFEKSGFDRNRIFATQGSYSKMQCSKPCHNKLYDITDLDLKMLDNTSEDLKIPTDLIPKCPRCGSPMELNIRKDDAFVEDDNWHQSKKLYGEFKEKALNGKTLLMEIGVGFNTPIIIRFPFEDFARENDDVYLVRFNIDQLDLVMKYNNKYYIVPEKDIDEYLPGMASKYIPVKEDVNGVLDELLYYKNKYH